MQHNERKQRQSWPLTLFSSNSHEFTLSRRSLFLGVDLEVVLQPKATVEHTEEWPQAQPVVKKESLDPHRT